MPAFVIGPRLGWPIPEHWRVTANVLFQRDVFYLARNEVRRVAAKCGLDTILHVPPQTLSLTMHGRRARNNIVNFAPTRPMTIALKDHPTRRFLQEIIGDGKNYLDTELYRSVLEGQKIQRRVDGEIHGLIVDCDGMRKYYERCCALAQSVSSRGVVDLETEKELRINPDEGNIRVAIDEFGGFIHYRRGRHRLALAQIFGLESVPVSVRFISGRYLTQFLGQRRAYRFSVIAEAIRVATHSAVERASATHQ